MSAVIPYIANPGQAISIVVETTNADGYRTDPTVPPVIASVYFPDRTLAQGFPANMVKLETGLYVYAINIPGGTTSLGSFVVSAYYLQPETDRPVWQSFVINVARPFSNISASPI